MRFMTLILFALGLLAFGIACGDSDDDAPG